MWKIYIQSTKFLRSLDSQTPWEKPSFWDEEIALFSWFCFRGSFWYFFSICVIVVLLLSCVQLFATSWTAACQASLSFTICWSLLKLMSIEFVMSSKHLVLCRPFLFLPSTFPSMKAFCNELALCIRWPRCWNFSFIISPSNEYSGLISFKINWFDLLAVQGSLNCIVFNSATVVNRIKLAFNIKIFYKIHNEGKSSKNELSTYF